MHAHTHRHKVLSSMRRTGKIRKRQKKRKESGWYSEFPGREKDELIQWVIRWERTNHLLLGLPRNYLYIGLLTIILPGQPPLATVVAQEYSWKLYTR